MHFSMLNKSIMAMGLLGSMVSAGPVPSLSQGPDTNGTVAFVIGQYEGRSETDPDQVGHSLNESILAQQHELAKQLVPTTDVCPFCGECACGCVEGAKYLTGDLLEAVNNLTISLKQVNKNPITLEVSVYNNGTLPVTFWKDVSPLSSYADDLGYFKINNEIDGVKFGCRSRAAAHGYRPDNINDLCQIDPGQTETSQIKIPSGDTEKDKVWLEMLTMGGNTTVAMRGNWYGVWAAPKEEVMKSDMEYSEFGFNFWNEIWAPWAAQTSTEEDWAGCRIQLEFE
ncbi:hypothetical protein F53441_10531 [Fusarium austroafricanum]|uniref:Uncharacterized protein n=1 Tax=Fusarium austroafricanum TaxID=2364996 RepID=A0A8H4K8L5_9HYPO|nr:hypothetical protein F53441_10531 [Fusarium austroafricanum]